MPLTPGRFRKYLEVPRVIAWGAFFGGSAGKSGKSRKSEISASFFGLTPVDGSASIRLPAARRRRLLEN
jgi:hypothetical protein